MNFSQITNTCLLVSVLIFVWIGVDHDARLVEWFIPHFTACLVLVGIGLVNLWRCCFEPNARGRHAKLLILILLVLGLAPLSAWSHFLMEARWFANEGLKKFELTVRQIESTETLVSGEWQRVGPHIYKQRYEDNSLSVWFLGRAGEGRAGYLYHSGTNVIPVDGRINYFMVSTNDSRRYFRITNSWYHYQN